MADQSGSSGVEQAAEQAREGATEAVSRVSDTARSQVDQRSTDAGERVSSVAGDLRTVGEQLREQGNDSGAKVAEQVADRAERAGSYLTESDADRILSDVEDLARRQPWLVLAGGVALGIAAARFLKASSSQRYASRTRSQPGGSSTSVPSALPNYDQAGYGATPALGTPATPAPAGAPATSVGGGA